MTTDRKLKVTIHTAYVIGATVLLLTGFTAFKSLNFLLEKSKWVDHTHHVLFNTQKFISFVKDAETGQRGYLISGDSVYLEPFLYSTDSITKYLNQLHYLTRDNASQQARVEGLQQQTFKRIQLLSYGIELKNAQQHAKINELFSSGKSRTSMMEVTQRVTDLENEENRLLEIRSAALDQSILATQYTIYWIIISYVILAIISFILIQAFLHHKALQENVLTNLNKELLGANSDLSSSNAELATTSEELATTNEELVTSNELLEELRASLEGMVQERTRELAESYERFHLLLESIPQMAWTTSPEGIFTYCNQQWYHYTGLTLAEANAPSARNYFHPDEQQEIILQWKHSLQSGEAFSYAGRLKRADGVWRWHLNQVVPIRNEQGEIVLWAGTSTDLHDLKITQERLIEMNRELTLKNEALRRTNADLDSFIYVASHDLRAPVANLEGLVNYLRKKLDGKLKAEEQSTIEFIQSSLLKLKSTLNDLTTVIQTQVKKKETPEKVQVAELVQEVLAELQPEVQSLNAETTTFWEVSELVFVRDDLKIIIYNLISNAIKYHSPNRTLQITIRTKKEAGKTALLVEDNGIGIAAKHLPKIFSLFKRFHSQTDGSGIGLYLVKKLVEDNGGSIEVESEPNQRTRFTVYF